LLRATLGRHPARACLVLDFDGTIAAITEQPDAARVLGGVPEVLLRLARGLGRVAVVSGRPAAFLLEQLEPAARELIVVGHYGLEVAEGGLARLTEAGRRAAELRPLVDALAEEAEAEVPEGVQVERKVLSFALHWRRAPEREHEAMAIASRLASRGGLELQPARMAVELRPAGIGSKAEAVAWLAAGFEAVAFAGDDAADLAAFGVLDGLRTSGVTVLKIAVASSEAPASLMESADLAVGGPNELVAALERFARALEAAR
jgi:trehalose 6-phosphate phosphatase